MLFAQLHELFLSGFIEERAGRVTGVDDDQGFGTDTSLVGFNKCGFNLVDGGGPAGGFVKMIWKGNAVMLSECGGVQRVLWDGDQDSRRWRRDEHVNQE